MGVMYNFQNLNTDF